MAMLQAHILIAEDDDNSRIVLRQLLEQVGFSVLEAKDGRQAVEIYKRMQPDLIWMDIRLPVMDGLEATRRVREIEHESQIQNPKSKINRIPIIALTASVFKEDKEKVLEAGCDDFIGKPFHEEEIFDKMAQYLEVRYIYEEQEKQNKERIVARAITHSDLAELTTDWIDR
jgi:CheY-like chemotaxis protein